MKYTNALVQYSSSSSSSPSNSLVFDACLIDLLRLMAPITPCISQNLWATLCSSPDYRSQLWQWPSYDPEETVSSNITVIVQVNGKNKTRLTIPMDRAHDELLEQVKSSSFWQTRMASKHIKDYTVMKLDQQTVVNCIV